MPIAGWGTYKPTSPGGRSPQNQNWEKQSGGVEAIQQYLSGVARARAQESYTGGPSGGGSGGGFGGGIGPQQIDPLDLSAWDSQLQLQRKGTEQFGTHLQGDWKDTLSRLRLSTKQAKQANKRTQEDINLARSGTQRHYGENIRDLGQARDDALFNLFGDATQRGAMTAFGTQRQEGIIGREHGEGVGGMTSDLQDQLLQYSRGSKRSKQDLKSTLKGLKLDKRGARRGFEQGQLQHEGMKQQLWYDALARNQVQNQIGGQPINYIGVPPGAGEVTHFGGIGMRLY